MKGSWFHEAMESLYTPNTVKHMLDGKTNARDWRYPFLVEASLQLLLKPMVSEDKIDETDLKGIEELYKDIVYYYIKEIDEALLNRDMLCIRQIKLESI